MKKLAALALSLFLLMGTAYADSPKDTPKEAEAPPASSAPAAKPTPTKSNAEITAEMEELRQTLQAQQEQLAMLKEELKKRDQQIEEAREAAASASSRATEANLKASAAEATSAEVRTTTSALNTSVANLAASSASASSAAASSAAASTPLTTGADQTSDEEKGPMTIRFKGISITPGGFAAAETVNRTHALSAFATPFNTVYYPGADLGHVTEMNLSAAQSRLTLLAQSTIGTAKLTGYFESDFLGAAVTSNNRQTNSYVFRMRQAFGRVDLASGWAFTGGQMWSLATENKKGIVNRDEALPVMIDPNYVVGFTWQRAYAFRVTKSFGDVFTLAASLEGPQTTIGGHNFSYYTSYNVATGATTTYPNFFLNAAGNAAGLYNSLDATGYTPNIFPDFIVKAALDPGFGHYEVFGIVSEFRNRVYPCATTANPALGLSSNGETFVEFASGSAPLLCPTDLTATAPTASGAYNSTSTGGAVGASARLPLFANKLDVSAKGVYGDGTGRYGGSQLPDVTARPNGTLALIHNAQWLGKVEWHATPKWDFYAYLGGEYAGRAAYTGYTEISVTSTPYIPAYTNPITLLTQPAYPGVQTWKVTTNNIGGYGNKKANNSGCSEQTPPVPAGLAGGAAGAAGSSGFPGAGGSCNGDTRYIAEGTLGFWNRIYQGEKGRLQWGVQYSYLYRVGWSGSGDIASGPADSPKATDNMVFTSFRYYLP